MDYRVRTSRTGENPIVITTNATGYDKDKRDYFQTNGRVELQIPGVNGLKLTGFASLDKYTRRTKRMGNALGTCIIWDKNRTKPMVQRLKSTNIHSFHLYRSTAYRITGRPDRILT